jgi:hypothetical protein
LGRTAWGGSIVAGGVVQWEEQAVLLRPNMPISVLELGRRSTTVGMEERTPDEQQIDGINHARKDMAALC